MFIFPSLFGVLYTIPTFCHWSIFCDTILYFPSLSFPTLLHLCHFRSFHQRYFHFTFHHRIFYIIFRNSNLSISLLCIFMEWIFTLSTVTGISTIFSVTGSFIYHYVPELFGKRDSGILSRSTFTALLTFSVLPHIFLFQVALSFTFFKYFHLIYFRACIYSQVHVFYLNWVWIIIKQDSHFFRRGYQANIYI